MCLSVIVAAMLIALMAQKLLETFHMSLISNIENTNLLQAFIKLVELVFCNRDDRLIIPTTSYE